MDKFNFNDRPDAERLAQGISAANTNTDPDMVLQFLNFQWAYRRMQRQYDNVLAKNQLSESRFIILMFLYLAPDQHLLPSEIAQKLGTTRVTVTKMLQGMTTTKLVAKQPSPDDKRATWIHLTDDGQKVLLSFLPENFVAIQTLFGNLTTDDLQTLKQLLHKINQGTQTLTNEMEK